MCRRIMNARECEEQEGNGSATGGRSETVRGK